MDRCPIKMLGGLLSERNMLSESDRTEICKDIDREIEEAITSARESPYPDEGTLLNYVFKD